MFNPNPKLVLTNQFGEVSINAIGPESNDYINNHVVTLTAAQVIALNATPQVLVPAVAGKVIKVLAVKMSYVHGSAAFTIGSNKHLTAQYATSGQLIAQAPETGFIDQSSSTEADVFGPGVGGIAVRGKAVNLTSDDSTIAVGTDSTLVCTTYYQII